jgi:ketosteroid isomerase-like protein
MITGVHTMFYSSDPDATRAFLRDRLQLTATDLGDGWLIFDLPDSEMGVHPADTADAAGPGTHNVSFYCDDLEATLRELRGRGVEPLEAIADEEWGRVTRFGMPGGVEVQLYQPRYARQGALGLVRGVYKAFARGDVAALLGALAPDAEWCEAEGLRYADGSPYVGPARIAEGVFARLGQDWESFAVEPQRFSAAGATVLVEGRYRGVVRATGRALDAQLAHVWTVRAGQITRFQQYTDTAQWAWALGDAPRR